MLFRFLMVFMLVWAASPTEAEASSTAAPLGPPVAVTGAVYAVVANEHGVVASQQGHLVWVSPQGDVVRRPIASPRVDLPTQRSQRQAQAQADQELFDRHGVEEDLRHEVEGEQWLDDVRPLRSASPQADLWLQSADEVPILAANAAMVFVGTHEGLFQAARPGTLRKVMPWRQQPEALAVSTRGRVAFASPLGVSLLGPGAQSAICAATASAPEQLAVLETPAVSGTVGPCVASTLIWRQGPVVTLASRAGVFALPWRASSLAECGGAVWVNAEEGLFRGTPSGKPEPVVAWQRVGPAAPHPQIRCAPQLPWAVAAFAEQGGRASVSADGGRSWRPLALPVGMPVADVALSELGPWLATPWGLAQGGLAAPATGRPLPENRDSRGPPAVWTQWLPLVDLTATVGTRTQSRAGEPLLASQKQTHDSSLWLTAEFPLSTRPRRMPSPAPRPWESSVTRLAQFADPGASEADWEDTPATVPNAAARETAPVGDSPTGQSLPTTRAPAPRPMPAPRRPPRPAGPPACLADLREAAVALAMAHPQRLQSLVARARHAAWLPELRFRAEKRLGRNQSLDFDSDTIFAPLGVRTVNDMRLEVRASWDLSRVVFSPDELAATVQAARIAESRREVSVLVNRLFFERRRREASEATSAQAAQWGEQEDDLEDSAAPASRARRRLRSTTNLQPMATAELSADLDALTGGLAATCR